MSPATINPRRHFLKLSARLAALGLAAGSGFGKAGAVFADAGTTVEVDDYKALVCIYLFGGNDGNNVIVPRDSRYTTYQNLRGGLALGGNKLLPDIADASQTPWGLHYGLTEINNLYSVNGPVAFVLNVGMLERPLTRLEYQQGLAVPTLLFSHSDQTLQAQTGIPTTNGTGWGGRLLDFFGNSDTMAAMSMTYPALFLQGYDVGGNSVPPGSNLTLAGMSHWQQSHTIARKQAVTEMLGLDGGKTLRQTANKMFADGLQLASALQGTSGVSSSSAVFPGTSIGNQLKEVSRLINLRAQQGPGRQVFFCSIDGFDLHSGQDWMHWYLLSSLSQALGAFHQANVDNGVGNKVTTFTQSEFSRTLQPSGSGSDHAWGGHVIVLGGAVKGGVYGTLPTLELGGPNDANTRGVWIPTISTAQFGATLGKWFGASDADIAQAFPNLYQFTVKDLGFMKP